MTTASATIKKTARTRRTTDIPTEVVSATKPVTPSVKILKIYEESFTNLLHAVNNAKDEFMALQKEIDEVRESWNKEQKDHETAILERNQQEEVARKRENETYNYEITLARKKAEDEFLEKKAKWERELEGRKEDLAKEKLELEALRKQASSFEAEKEKAIKQSQAILQKELSDEYATERKLREQETKSEKELLALKITNFTQENARQENEITTLKKALENAASQLKDVAVKVIESSSNKPQASLTQEP